MTSEDKTTTTSKLQIHSFAILFLENLLFQKCKMRNESALMKHRGTKSSYNNGTRRGLIDRISDRTYHV